MGYTNCSICVCPQMICLILNSHFGMFRGTTLYAFLELNSYVRTLKHVAFSWGAMSLSQTTEICTKT